MTKKRAVITGMGSISCIGTSLEEISKSLKDGNSGISKNGEYDDLGFRSKISGSVEINLKDLIDLKTKAEETLKKLKEQRELLVKERDGLVGTEDPS